MNLISRIASQANQLIKKSTSRHINDKRMPLAGNRRQNGLLPAEKKTVTRLDILPQGIMP
jgi:hypothetical protein